MSPAPDPSPASAPALPWPGAAPSPFATRSDPARGRLTDEPESTTRSPFQRDRDRVIHAGAFRKLKYKTQVFVHHEGDYFRTRLTHSIEVAQIARSISRTLGLNEDLAEAVALAHDLGHTPFGHAGEDALSACMAAFGGFSHNDQSLRVVTRLERRYAAFDGLNLTLETLDGLIKHNGPLADTAQARPHLPVTIAALAAERDLQLHHHAGPEAQVAALADDIAYINHDLDDGLRAGLLTLEAVRAAPLVGPLMHEVEARYPGLERGRLVHETVRRLIDRMVGDLVHETQTRLAALDAAAGAAAVRQASRPTIAFSSVLEGDLKALRRFLTEGVYRHYKVNRMTSKGRRIVRDLFHFFMAEPNCLPSEWQTETEAGGPSGSDQAQARVIADYIAGMTDRFAVAEHQRLFDLHLPNP